MFRVQITKKDIIILLCLYYYIFFNLVNVKIVIVLLFKKNGK